MSAVDTRFGGLPSYEESICELSAIKQVSARSNGNAFGTVIRAVGYLIGSIFQPFPITVIGTLSLFAWIMSKSMPGTDW